MSTTVLAPQPAPGSTRRGPTRARPRTQVAPPRPVGVGASRAATAQRSPRLAPFVLLMLALLAGGLVAMLLLNTVLAQGAFREAELERTSAKLFDEEQRLSALNAREASAQSLAKKATALGMVDSCGGPKFISVKTGETFGEQCVPGAPAKKPTPGAASSNQQAGAGQQAAGGTATR